MPRFFVVCTPGLEPFLRRELKDLGLNVMHSPDLPVGTGSPDETGGVEFQGMLSDAYRANLHLRTASRVLLQLGSFHAGSFSDVRRRAKRLPWEDHIPSGQAISLRVICQRSRLFHSDAVGERVVDAIADRLGRTPRVQGFAAHEEAQRPQLIIVRVVENRCTIHVDSSGALLYRRGYRLATAKAPLRETLASGMLLASGWDRVSPLLDPFCGSGTIAIEAAMLAGDIAPGSRRSFAFMDWPNFNPDVWKKLLAEKKPGGRIPAKILASDRDAGAIQAARANAQRAGVWEGIEFSCQPISEIDPPPAPGWVVTNPPYGVRLDAHHNLEKLYARFGKALRTKCPGWKITMLCSSSRLLRATGLKFDAEIRTRNGGLKVKLVRGVVASQR